MGTGSFSNIAYASISATRGYANKSRQEIFQSRKIDVEMDPTNIEVRESRDSEEHPESVPVIVALDVTGSMGFVPEELVKNTLPDLMMTLIDAGIKHPQILFLGIGDHVYDRAPLQVGQFESSAELLDRWLTKVYLEQGGGENNGESYHLAWLFAARHTKIDCWDKRKQKGFIFTIGDEPCLTEIPADTITRLTTADQASTVTTEAILKEAQERYHVHHMHVLHDPSAATERRQKGWRELIGQQFVLVEDYRDLAKRIATTVIDVMQTSSSPMASSVKSTPIAPASPLDIHVEEML